MFLLTLCVSSNLVLEKLGPGWWSGGVGSPGASLRAVGVWSDSVWVCPAGVKFASQVPSKK